MRLGFVVPWHDAPEGWIVPHLPPGFTGTVFPVAPQKNNAFPSPYLREYYELAKLEVRHRLESSCDVIFAWEMRSIFAVALLRRGIPALRRIPFVAVAPIIKGHLRHISPFVRSCLAEADKILCFSKWETENYPKRLGLDASRFAFVPSPWDCSHFPVFTREDGYILALGHSERDYKTLIRAVENTDTTTLIVANSPQDVSSDSWHPPSADVHSKYGSSSAYLPENVRVRYNTPSRVTDELIEKAILNVLPLKESCCSAGQSVLLRTMAQGKATVVSDVVGIRDYLHPGETGLVVPPYQPALLGEAILHLLNNKAERDRMGANAARAVREVNDFPVFAAWMAAVAQEVRR